jgi:hypothetical protein
VLHAAREALESFSPGDVAQCVRRKGALQGELSQLVERRRNAVRILATTLGIEPSGGGVVPLLPHVPAPQASRLRDALGALRTTLLRIRRLQRVNGALIDASLRLIGEVVHAYRQLLPGTRYDERAAINPGPTPDAVDQRA